VAVGWAQRLRADGRIGEFSLSPASLEDVYVELVGTIASSPGSVTNPLLSEVAHARAA
jgi:hypothetical protein